MEMTSELDGRSQRCDGQTRLREEGDRSDAAEPPTR